MFWLGWFLAVSLCFLIDMVIKSYMRSFYPTPTVIIQERRALKMPLERREPGAVDKVEVVAAEKTPLTQHQANAVPPSSSVSTFQTVVSS